MDRRKSQNTDTGNNNESGAITPSDGFIPEYDNVKLSQCVSCKHSTGSVGCKKYAIRPRRYQFVSSGLRCPHYEKT